MRPSNNAAILTALALAACAFLSPLSAAGTAPSLHQDVVNAYLHCDWKSLDALLKDRARDLASLPSAEAADVSAIRTAENEVRPAWWDGIKKGKKVLFHPALWGRSFAATYDPELKSSMQLSVTNDVPAISVNWLAADMDSAAPAEHGFTRGELTDLAIFATLGSVDSWSALPPADKPLDEAGKLALARYLDFRGNLAGVAYANPGGRRWGYWLFLAASKPEFARIPTRQGRKAVASLLLCEVLTRPQLYTSFGLPKTLPEQGAEDALAVALADSLEKKTTPAWTFAEDQALRLAAKQFSNANGTKAFTSGTVILPNKLSMAFDPRADEPLAPKRDAWIKQQFDALHKN